jgi:hypothetical protein
MALRNGINGKGSTSMRDCLIPVAKRPIRMKFLSAVDALRRKP